MRFHELFLTETTEEDRALISLSSAIYTKLQQYVNSEEEYDDDINEIRDVGRIGKLFDTPIPVLDDIEIEVQSDEGIYKRAQTADPENVERDPTKKYIIGLWVPDNNAMVFNEDHLNSNAMKTAITHELRHALDDKKSNFRAGDSKRYFPQANDDKETTYSDDEEKHKAYLKQPGEINSRFAEVLHSMVPAIRRAYALPPDKIKSRLLSDLNKNLNIKRIPEFFPGKEKSPAYRRLIKRAMDLLQKEMKHHEAELAKAGRPKVATGNW